MAVILPPSPPPERPSVVHVRPCKHCPSAHHPPDPEALDIRDHWPREAQVASVFPCAWRPEALCRGYCDFLGVSDGDLAALEAP